MKFTYLLFIVSFLIFTSCKKEGCTDELANNTSSDATKDDGSCTYTSSVVFWHNSTTRSALSNQGVSSLNFFLDGSPLGSSGITTTFASAPGCDEQAAFVREIAYDEQSVKVLNYEVKDQNDQLLFTGSVTFTSNECISEELHF